MDFFLQEPGENRLPPEEVRLRKIQIAPNPNGDRVKIYLELTPFKKRPNIELTIFSSVGKKVAHTSILGAVLHKMELVMHLRTPEPGSHYRLETNVYYQQLPEPSETSVEVPLPEPMVVDHGEVTFTLPLSGP